MYILYMMHNIDAYRILLYDEKRALSQKILNRYYFAVFEVHVFMLLDRHEQRLLQSCCLDTLLATQDRNQV